MSGILNKSLFNGISIDKRLIEANSILTSLFELKEYLIKFATVGSEIEYDYSDREVIIYQENDNSIRVDIGDISSSVLNQLGTKLTLYIDLKELYRDSSLPSISPNDLINDLIISSDTTYSSQKLESLLSQLGNVNTLLNEINILIQQLQDMIDNFSGSGSGTAQFSIATNEEIDKICNEVFNT